MSLFIPCINRAPVSIMSYVKWHYVFSHIAMKEKFVELGSVEITSVSIGNTPEALLGLCFPLYLGNKARWSLWLHLPGVSRAGAESVHLLRVPVCQRISGKWGCCLPLLLRVDLSVIAVSSAALSPQCGKKMAFRDLSTLEGWTEVKSHRQIIVALLSVYALGFDRRHCVTMVIIFFKGGRIMTEKTVIFPVACRWWRRPLTCCVLLWCRKLDNTSIRRTTVLPLVFNYPVLIFQNTSFILFLWNLQVTFCQELCWHFFLFQVFPVPPHTQASHPSSHKHSDVCIAIIRDAFMENIDFYNFIICVHVCVCKVYGCA